MGLHLSRNGFALAGGLGARGGPRGNELLVGLPSVFAQRSLCKGPWASAGGSRTLATESQHLAGARRARAVVSRLLQRWRIQVALFRLELDRWENPELLPWRGLAQRWRRGHALHRRAHGIEPAFSRWLGPRRPRLRRASHEPRSAARKPRCCDASARHVRPFVGALVSSRAHRGKMAKSLAALGRGVSRGDRAHAANQLPVVRGLLRHLRGLGALGRSGQGTSLPAWDPVPAGGARAPWACGAFEFSPGRALASSPPCRSRAADRRVGARERPWGSE